jgi:hypothetical protein
MDEEIQRKGAKYAKEEGMYVKKGESEEWGRS